MAGIDNQYHISDFWRFFQIAGFLLCLDFKCRLGTGFAKESSDQFRRAGTVPSVELCLVFIQFLVRGDLVKTSCSKKIKKAELV